MNLYEIKNNSIVEDRYNDNHYRVIENDRHGMGTVENLSNGNREIWNSCNNDRFIPLKGQLEFKFK